VAGEEPIMSMPASGRPPHLVDEHPTFVTHLECGLTGEVATGRHHPRALGRRSSAARPLRPRGGGGRRRTARRSRRGTTTGGSTARSCRCDAAQDIVSLGETFTPLVSIPRTTARLGAKWALVKDEGRLPTGSFKARGLAMAVAMAKELGLTGSRCRPTATPARRWPRTHRVPAWRPSSSVPADTPEVNVREIALQGAHVWRVDGFIDDCGRIVGEGKEHMGWFDVSTLKEPYRIEGKKTMGLELLEQLGWEVPDVILYPTGGGTGLIGMWKAFAELEAMGWIGPERPRMIAVQASGCAPIVKAYEDGERHATRWEGAHTIASGIRVPGGGRRLPDPRRGA
jgi:threonine synthase